METTKKILVQVRFKVTSKYPEINDALYYTADDYANLQEADIDTVIQQRFDDFVFALQNQVASAEPKLQELISEKDELLRQLSDLQERIDALGN